MVINYKSRQPLLVGTFEFIVFFEIFFYSRQVTTMSFSSVNATVAYIDHGTFSELEGFLYGGPEAITWFVAGVQKANWFSMVPITLRNQNTMNFGAKLAAASVNRSGDYVLNAWFRCQIPQIQLYDSLAGVIIYNDASLRWTRNLMHNLFSNVQITFNELNLHEFDNYWLDFNYVFRAPSNKRLVYDNMIGNVSDMVTPVLKNTALGTGGYFSVVLPFFFGEDTGVALPVAAVPLNDVKINYTMRNWQELVVLYPGTAAAGGGRSATLADVRLFSDNTAVPTLLDCTTNVHYAVVHNDERVKMGDAPRDIVIHQCQTIQQQSFRDVTTRSSFDLRLSHAVVLFCFAALNTTIQSFSSGNSGQELSNYTTEPNYAGLDPIAYTTLVYENSLRLAQGSDYYSYIFPYLFSDGAATEPEHTGMHMWSYSVKAWDPLQPGGSTGYSKLANVSLQHDMSPACIAAAAAGALDSTGVAIQWPVAGALTNMPQTFSHVFVARNWNIARVSNASIGLPAL